MVLFLRTWLTASRVAHIRLVLGGVSLILLLLLAPQLYQWWNQNKAHLYLYRTTAYSPYLCLIDQEFCESKRTSARDRAAWHFRKGTQGELYLQEERADSSQPAAIPISPNRRPLRVLAEGALSLEENHRDEAVSMWKREPNLASYLAAVAGQLNEPERAVEIYALSLEVNPTVPAHLQQGILLFQLKRYSEARDTLLNGATLLESAPDNIRQRYEPRIYLYLGHTYRKLGELELARASYERSLEFDEEWVGAMLGLAEVSIAEGETQAAFQLLEQLVALKPASPAPNLRLAQLHVDQGDLPAAREAAEQLTSSYSTYAAGWQLLGYIAFNQGDYASALAAYRRYLQLSPGDPGVERRVLEIERLLDNE